MVKCEPLYEPLARHLLSSTWLVDSLETALGLRKLSGAGLRFVTAGGELLENDGSIVVGPAAAKEARPADGEPPAQPPVPVPPRPPVRAFRGRPRMRVAPTTGPAHAGPPADEKRRRAQIAVLTRRIDALRSTREEVIRQAASRPAQAEDLHKAVHRMDLEIKGIREVLAKLQVAGR